MAAPSFVNATIASGTGASVSASAPSGLASGDHQLIITISGTSGGSYPTISGFTRVAEFSGQPSGDDSSWRGAIFTASSSTNTGAIEVTNPNSSRLFTVARAAWRGGDGWLSSPAPASATTSAGTSYALPTQATTAADQVVIGVVVTDTGDGASLDTTFTMPSPWTERLDDWEGAGFESQAIGIFEAVRSASGTQSGTVTASRSDVGWVFAATLAAADDAPPADPPGAVFDLSDWKWTGPVEDPNDPGDAIEIQQPELDTYSSPYFQLDGSNNLVFTAPVQGETTSGSGGTRSELREMENGTEAAWTPFDAGLRQLTVTERVDPAGITDREEMIIGQIHAGANPAVYIAAEWESSGNPVTPRLRVFKDRNDGSGGSSGVGNMLSGSLTTSTVFTWRIAVENEQVIVSAALGGPENLPTSGTTNRYVFDATDDFEDDQDWYFKAGAYNKSEVVDGGTGSAIATVSFIELIQPGDSGGTTYVRTGIAGAIAAGSGTRVLDEHEVHVRTGAGAALPAGAGSVQLDEHDVLDRTGGAAALVAGTGARQRVRSFTGGAAALAAGAGAVELDEHDVLERTGAAAALAAGAGAVELDEPATHDRAGHAAAIAVGAGAVALDEVNVYDRTGSAAALPASHGSRALVRSFTGAAGVLAAGSGTQAVTPATAHERTGAAAVLAAGSGTANLAEPGVHERTGGAAALVTGAGAVQLDEPTEHERSGRAAALAAGDGLRGLVRSFTGESVALAAGSGTVQLVEPAVHERTGEAAAIVTGGGSAQHVSGAEHEVTGGGTALAAGRGTVAVTSPAVHARSGGAAALAAGLVLVDIIHPATHLRAGSGGAIAVGTGRARRGGRLHAGRPYRVGSWHAAEPIASGRLSAAAPYATGQHHAGPT